MEQRINRPMTFVEVQSSGRAGVGGWGGGELHSCSLCQAPLDSSIKSQRAALCRQTCCALVSLHNQDISENRTLVWCCRLTQERRDRVAQRAQTETGAILGTGCRCSNLDE